MPIDTFQTEVRLKETLADILRRVSNKGEVDALVAGQILADGLTRYLVFSRRPRTKDGENLDLMIESLEFWASLHGYSRRKAVQKASGAGARCMAVAAAAG